MKRIAPTLVPPPFPTAPTHWPRIAFMTGARFWHQTIFCARSLEYACRRRLAFEILDDSTLDVAHGQLLRRLFPGVTIIGAPEGRAIADTALPIGKFPALHRVRAGHVMMRKLVDLRAGRNGPHLYLDSDMLFFSEPHRILRWLESPDSAIFLDDRPPSSIGVRDGSLGYVHSTARVRAAVGVAPVPFVNGGLVGLDDSAINWAEVEDACARLLPTTRADHAMFEQTLSALIMAQQASVRLPSADYRCCYFDDQIADCTLLHYLHRTKETYLASEWSRWLNASGIGIA